MSDAPKAVFLSYASQDADAAKKICDALRASNVEVWFDQSELVGGDAWDTKIRKQIRECALLIPVISKTTQARREAYFRLEWKLADERTHLMAKGTPFLLPVTIDETSDREALVPDAFLAVQWTKAPNGEVPLAFVARVRKLLEDGMETGRPRPAERGGGTPPSSIERTPRLGPWLAIGALVVVGLALAISRPWERTAPATSASSSTPQASHLPMASAAPADFPRDPDLKRVYGMLYNVYDGIAEDFALMDDIVKPLLVSRPNDPEVVTVAAELAQEFVTRGFDVSDARRAQAQRLTERAVQLAPDNPEALAALGYYLYSTRSQLGRAEDLLRRAIKLKPTEPRFHCFLYSVLAASKNPEAELGAFAMQMATLFPRDPMVSFRIGIHLANVSDFAGAEQWIDKTLTLAPLPYAIMTKAQLMLEVHGDIAGMERSLGQMPERTRTSAAVLNAYAVLATVTGQTGSARRVLEATADTWLVDGTYVFPRALRLGELEQIDEHEDVARRQFEAALKEIKARQAANPSELYPIRAELWAQIGLGHQDEARAALRTNLEKRPRPYRWNMGFTWWTSALRACLLLGERAQALALLKEACAEAPGRLLLRNLFRVDPKMAPFRADPEILALLAEPEKAAIAAPASDKSVAVLAFADLSEKHDSEYFSDGISEELLNVLAKIPGLKVSARTSAFYFKGKEVPVPEIAKQLGVAYVVEGSVRKQGDKVRITAQLIKAADGFHVWSDTFTRDLKDIFAVQDEIAGLITKNISPVLSRTAPTSARQIDPEAFQAYLAGRALATKAGMTNLGEAAALFGKAIERDPTYAMARVQQARAYIQLGRWGGLVPRQAWAAAKAALAPALLAEPDSPDVLVAQGWLLRTADWKWREAESAFRRAIELRPNDPDVLTSAAVLLVNIGKSEDAFKLVQRALELDPLNPATQLDLGMIYRFSERLPEAEHQFRRAIELSPQGQRFHTFLSMALSGQGRYDEAEREARADRDELSSDFALGLVAAGRGDAVAVRAILRRFDQRRSGMEPVADLCVYAASLRAAIGEMDAAFAELDQAMAARDPSIPWIKVNYSLNPLHADPRWDALLHKVGLADDQLK